MIKTLKKSKSLVSNKYMKMYAYKNISSKHNIKSKQETFWICFDCNI